MKRYVFAYGSLLNAKSAQNTIARALYVDDFLAVEVSGYEQIWGYSTPVDFADGVQNGVFLTLIENPKKSAFGALIKIDESEFQALVKREKDYEILKIPTHLIKNTDFDKKLEIYAFGRSQKVKIKGVIPALYIQIIQDGIAKFDPKFQKQYRKAVFLNLPFEMKDGKYSFVDSVQNSLVKG